MKLLLINSVCDSKSTGSICYKIAQEYIENGHEAVIAYGRDDVTKINDIKKIRIGSRANILFHLAKSRLFDESGFGSIRSTKQFIKWAEKYDPDILWMHNLHGYYINIELLFDWIKSRPKMLVKWTLHDCWGFTGHCSHFECIKCEKWKTGCYNCEQIHEYPKSFILDNSKRNFERKKNAFSNVSNLEIITPSKWLMNLVKQSFLNEYPIEVRYNTINHEIFKPRKSRFRELYKLEKKYIILGVASDWDRKKGLDDFKRLADILSDEYQIILVGLTEKQIQALPSSIIGIKRTKDAIELAEIYTAADLFVNLTYQDTYPTVNLEAQACGTPCITYNTGGSPESVPMQNVVPQGDLSAIVDMIMQQKYTVTCEKS